MEKEEQRNFIIAMALMIAFVFGYQKFVMEPAQKKYEAEQAAIAATEQGGETESTITTVDTGTDGTTATFQTVDEAIASATRIPFDGPSLDGTIRLSGARIDDLSLRKHFLTVARKEEVRLMRPEESEFGWFATYYWADGNKLIAGRNSPWLQVGEGMLTPATPVTLRLAGEGVTIDRVITIDDNYMFTFRDTVTNTSDTARTFRAVGSVERQGEMKGFLEATDPGSAAQGSLAHMGLMGVLDKTLVLKKYKPLIEMKKIKGEEDGVLSAEAGGWWGLTDKYWMGALVPQQDRGFKALVNKASLAKGGPLEIRTESAPIVVEPGASLTSENRIFTGAKRFEVLQAYQNDLGIPRMVDAVDWGWAFFLTKPFFYALNWLSNLVGSFGWAILVFTVLIKLPLVPLYNKSYKSMAKMKKLQEPLAEIKERFKADPQRQQKETMALMKSEGANPIGGCLPILFTIPIFYALYKTLYVTLEMRHTPFGFLKDLSAPDPTAIGNLFGLLPWAAADVKAIPIIGIIIGVGILPILYGVTMASMQSLNPPPPDPTQRRIMMMLPIVFMFVFGGFAAGLVMYWVWSNILSFGQQYYIMRRNGVETELGKFVKRLFGGNKKPAS